MTAAATIPFRPTGRMTDAQYERERAALLETYGESSREAGAKRDQGLATLFYRSGWTQEDLAKKEGMSQQRIGQSLRFGRFLDFTTGVVNSGTATSKLSEGFFRRCWERTDKTEGNERIRFQEVVRIMSKTSLSLSPRPTIHDELIKQFADGQWHRLPTMAAHLKTDEQHVVDTLTGMKKRAAGNAHCESKSVANTKSYRIFPKEKSVSSIELAEKLRPIIKDLRAQACKDIATYSIQAVRFATGKLEQLLDEWTE